MKLFDLRSILPSQVFVTWEGRVVDRLEELSVQGKTRA